MGRPRPANQPNQPGISSVESVIAKNVRVVPTVVYDTFWRFAAERQQIFFRRLHGQPEPWSADVALNTYKFTNAYRASDRVSQYLIKRVIYRDDLPDAAAEVLFRVLLFKVFNKIETWERLEEAIGPLLLETYDFQVYDRVLSAAMASGESIYSPAYIMPSASSFGYKKKHRNHLALIETMVKDDLAARIREARCLKEVFELLRAYPSIGDFLAYQFAIDLNYSELTHFPEGDFVVAGPGALDGIRKCFADTGGLSPAQVIRLVTELQEQEFESRGIDFPSLWGRPLQLIDCQNLFCEVDKYARIMHPDIMGISKRTRIKQKFRPHAKPLAHPWYPPKWGLNDHLDSLRGGGTGGFS